MPSSGISFVLPMYNENDTIARTLKDLSGMAERLSNDYEIIVSDDGSSDNSGAVVLEMAKSDSRVKLERLEKNTKFGGALKAGLKRAERDVIVYTDSDLPIGLEDLKGALKVLDSCDIVTAYSKVHKGETLKRKVMSKVYNFLIQVLFRTNIKDINSGFKIFRKKVFKGMELISNSPFVDVEIFVNAKRKKFIIKQYPVVFKNRDQGTSYMSKPAVVLKTLGDMLRFRLGW